MEVLHSLPLNEVLYTEIAEPGAMGNAGGVLIFIGQGKQLMCYETSVFSDEKSYSEACNLFYKYKNNEIDNNQPLFDYHYGGMGNHVFVNRNIPLNVGDGFLNFKKEENEYPIFPSVVGVFNCVSYSINNPESKID